LHSTTQKKISKMASMIDNLEAWAKDAAMDDEGNATELTQDDWESCEEVSLDDKTFAGNKISSADWDALVKKCPSIEAFSSVDSKLTAIETPTGTKMEPKVDEDGIPLESGEEEEVPICKAIQVLDLSKNAIGDLSFVKGFPELISLTMLENTAITKVEQLEALKAVEGTLQMLELDTDKTANFLGCADEEALRKKVWEIIPNLVGFNGANSDGDLLDMDMAGLLEEEGFGDEEEDDMDMVNWDQEEEDFEEEDFDEDFDEEEESLEEEEDEGEPEAKRSKKTE